MAKSGRKRKMVIREPNGRAKRVSRTLAVGDRRTGVYVMALYGVDTCKVGISKNPAGRVREIQCSQHMPVCLFWVGRCESRVQALQIERRVHQRLKKAGKHQSGEWFFCGAEFARSEVMDAAKSLGFEMEDDDHFGWSRRSYSEWPVVNGEQGRLPNMRGKSWPVV